MKKLLAICMLCVMTVTGCSSSPNAKGIVCYTNGEYDKALVLLSNVMFEGKADEETYTYSGLCHYRKKEYMHAARDLGKAVEKNPKYAPAFRGLGLVYTETGPYRFAENYFNRAISLNPDFAYAYFGRAKYYLQVKQYKEAAADLEKTLEFVPDHMESLMMLEPVLFSLAELQEKNEKTAEALKTYKRILEITPDKNGKSAVKAKKRIKNLQ